MDDAALAAFERLLEVAMSDTGQSRQVASFILAWWNADSLGGFDVADIFAVDSDIARGMAIVVVRLAEAPAAEYPERPPYRDREPHQVVAAEVGARSVEA